MSYYQQIPDLYTIAKVASQAATVARSAQQIATVASTALSTGYQTGRSGYQYLYPKRKRMSGRNGRNGFKPGVFTASGQRMTKRQVIQQQRRADRGTVPAYNQGYLRTGGFYGYSSSLSNELKFHDIDVDDGSILIGGTILNSGTINIIAQGNTESTRIGRKSVIKAINWRYQLRLSGQESGATARVAETVRVILYLDKQCNGATATILDILDTANYQSFNNLANKQRFRILMDRMIDLQVPNLASEGAGVLSSSPYKVSGSFYKKCNITIEYDNSATTGVLTTMRSNNLGVLTIADVGSIAQMDSKFRLRFTDS